MEMNYKLSFLYFSCSLKKKKENNFFFPTQNMMCPVLAASFPESDIF